MLNTTQVDPRFWTGKKVFLTGHTGFKGAWLSLWLAKMGAHVTGFALAPNTTPSMFSAVAVAECVAESIIDNICHAERLKEAIVRTQPDIVIHMAAQALVRYSYDHPLETYETNVIGTVKLLEAVRCQPSVRAVVVVTTDKCYENKGLANAFTEDQPLGGHDPYSSSKGCAELVVAAYQRSYFSTQSTSQQGVALASARAGNVVGGGDWSLDRLVPDAIKAFETDQPLMLRYQNATRPWQHVLEPLAGYLILAQNLFNRGPDFVGAWNFGPANSEAQTVKFVVDLLIKEWGDTARWQQDGAPTPHEAHFLALDCTKANAQLGWTPRWNLSTTIQKVVSWHKAYIDGQDMTAVSSSQIDAYQNSQPLHLGK